MARFAVKSPEQQAHSVEKALQKSNEIASTRTLLNYTERLEQVAKNMPEFSIKGEIRDLTPETAIQYLEARGQDIGQKTLDMERQAIQSMLTHVTGKLEQGERLPVIKSEHEQALSSRAYTAEQVKLIAESQTDKHALSTQLAYAAGLRAHELHTLSRASEKQANERPALDSKFQGRAGVIYTVTGKGGLTREVLIPNKLADKLEERRLDVPQKITDRGVHYEQKYDIGAGQKWSNSYTQASNRALSWSEGAHGLRHSYAQERMNELQNSGYFRDTALKTVSQELGHFRPEITEVYLR